MGTNNLSWIGPESFFGSFCNLEMQDECASKVGRWHARVALKGLDDRAVAFGVRNCEHALKYGPQVVASACSGFNGIVRSFGYQYAEFYDQWMDTGVDMNKIILHAWCCEAAKETQEVLLRDDWEPKLAVFPNVLTLLDGPQLNLRTGNLEDVLNPTLLVCCGVCDDICQASPNRTACKDCLHEMIQHLKDHPVEKLAELAKCPIRSRRTGTTVAASLLYACKKRCCLMGENSKFLLTASEKNLQTAYDTCHDHWMTFTFVFGDTINRGLVEYRERVGYFALPYKGKKDMAQLLHDERQLQLRMMSVFDSLELKSPFEATDFFANVDKMFHQKDIRPRKMRTDTGVKRSKEAGICDYVTAMEKLYEDANFAMVQPRCPKSMSKEMFNSDPHFWNSGPQGQAVIRYNDLTVPGNTRNAFIGWGCGASRAVLRQNGVGTFTRKGHWFDRERRVTLGPMCHFVGNGWDPDDFPHVVHECQTKVVRWAGDSMASTFSQDLLTTLHTTYEYLKPKEDVVRKLRIQKGLTERESSSSSSTNSWGLAGACKQGRVKSASDGGKPSRKKAKTISSL
jgi:hypothetical protein